MMKRKSSLKRELRIIKAEGISFSVMVGLGETYVPAFVLAIGLGEVTAGLIVTIPLLIGAVLQLISPYLVLRLGSYRKWIILCTTVQAASLLPLVLAAIRGTMPAIILFFIVTLYWAGGLSTGPSWNSWMEQVIPKRIRSKYFARRTGYAQAAVFLSLLIGGLALQLASRYERTLTAFAVLFAMASLARFVSAGLHSTVSEKPLNASIFRIVSLKEMIDRVEHAHEIRLLIFVLCMQIAVYTAAPYFSPYMLGYLQLPYYQYVALLGASFLFKIVTLAIIGNYVARIGPYRLLTIGTYAILPLSVLWIVSENFYYLMALQAIAGVSWAFFELAILLLIFEAIDEHERASILTVFNLAQAVAMTIGSLFGSILLSTFVHAKLGYSIIFVFSFLTRLAVVFLLKWVERLPLRPVPLEVRTLTVRPSEGSIDRPILSSIEDDGSPDGDVSESG